MNIQIYFNNKFIELSSNDIQNSQNQAIKKSYLLNDNKLNFNIKNIIYYILYEN